jgi:hypothetical protein
MFYDPITNAKKKVQQFKDNGNFLCMDNFDTEGNPVDLNFYGSGDTNSHRRLSIIFEPCVPEQISRQNEAEQSTRCLADLTSPSDLRRKLNDSKNYIKSPDMVFYFNQEIISMT